ncbi:hypothetical protein NPIL_141001 [Nephila pilipes]|uniref:Uncharacterized protein n=1 Tax=Nephila pilipes TaxID=299642 RepID=A0A8X6TAB9_NEPPI|nr:hypothetical protein NPIL_141001 [Nephila pilipes]
MAIGTLFEVQDQGSTDADRQLKWQFYLLRKVEEKQVDDAFMPWSGELQKCQLQYQSIKYFDLEVLSERYNRFITFVPPPKELNDGLSHFPSGRNVV